MSGHTSGNLPAACGVEAATSTGNARKRARKIQHRLAAIVSWQTDNNQVHRTTEATEEMCRRKIPRTPKPSTGRAFSSKYITSGVSFAEALQSKGDQTQQSHPRQSAVAATVTVDQPTVQTSSQWQEAVQSAQFASREHGQGRNCSTAVHDTVQ
jgi:hypothetical protein